MKRPKNAESTLLLRRFLPCCVLPLLVFSCADTQNIDYVMGEQSELGTHTYLAELPRDFDTFTHEQDVDVVIGTQGSLMVVTALRTNQIPWSESPFTITLAIANYEDIELSRISMRRYPTLESDGLMYFSHLYAVVNDVLGEEYSWDGRLGTLSVSVTSMDGIPYVDQSITLRLNATQKFF